MEPKLIALKLFLNELEIPTDIETIDDRKRVQKAIYLGQRSGADLGYRFSWYLKGPYSPSLAKDYYCLAESLATGEKDYERMELKQTFKDQLHRIKPIMLPPSDIDLVQEDWLELLASYHFLRTVNKFDGPKSREIIKGKKSHLFKYVEDAERILQEEKLL